MLILSEPLADEMFFCWCKWLLVIVNEALLIEIGAQPLEDWAVVSLMLLSLPPKCLCRETISSFIVMSSAAALKTKRNFISQKLSQECS